MEVLFSSVILVSFGSMLFVLIESVNINYKFSDKYKNMFASLVNVSRLRKGLYLWLGLEIFLLFIEVLFIFNFFLIIEPNKYDFFIIRITQLENFICIIVLFFLTVLGAILMKVISNSIKTEILKEIDYMDLKGLKLFFKHITKIESNKNNYKK